MWRNAARWAVLCFAGFYTCMIHVCYMMLCPLSGGVLQQELLKSKAERRALIQRALGVRREVLNHTQKVILNDCDSEFGALAV